MLRLLLGFVLGLTLIAGCGEKEAGPTDDPVMLRLKSPADPLTDQELQQFLQIVGRLPERRVPEFSPEQQDEFDSLLSASALVENYRNRFRNLFDPVRQGKVWLRNPELAAAAGEAKLTTVQFAALVRNISCALMKAELQPQQNLAKLTADCRSEIDALVQRIEQVDRLPPAELTGELTYQRTQSALRLGRMVALLEFTELLTSVPAQNLALIEKHRSELAPLVSNPSGDALTDPFAAEEAPSQKIQPTVYER
jgi:hypothetical protein